MPQYKNSPMKPKVYLAGPLFSDAERTFNLRLTSLLETRVQVYLPQRDGGLMSEMIEAGMSADIAAYRIFHQDVYAIQEADYLIAILDGRAIDEGVAFEIGVGFCYGKNCVGLQTDTRRLASWGNNPMITGALKEIFLTIDDLFEWIKCETVDIVVNDLQQSAANLKAC